MFEFTPMSWSEVKAYDMLTIKHNGRTMYFSLTSIAPPFYAGRAPTLIGRYVTKSGDLHRGRRQRWDASITVALADVVSVQRRDYRIYDVAVAEARAWQELRDNAYPEAAVEHGLRICDELDAEEAAALEADGGWGQPDGLLHSPEACEVHGGRSHTACEAYPAPCTPAATMPGFTRSMPCLAMPGHVRGGSHQHDHLIATGPECSLAWPIGKGDMVTRKGEPDGPRGVVVDTVTGVGVADQAPPVTDRDIELAMMITNLRADIASRTQTIEASTRTALLDDVDQIIALLRR